MLTLPKLTLPKWTLPKSMEVADLIDGAPISGKACSNYTTGHLVSVLELLKRSVIFKELYQSRTLVKSTLEKWG